MLSSPPLVSGDTTRARTSGRTAGYRLYVALDAAATNRGFANEQYRQTNPNINPNTNLGLPWTNENLQGEPNAVTTGRFRDAMHARDARLSFTGS